MPRVLNNKVTPKIVDIEVFKSEKTIVIKRVKVDRKKKRMRGEWSENER